MKIIDAHLHFCQEPYFDEIAELAGHKNTDNHLWEQYCTHHIVHGVVMGNRSLEIDRHQYPAYLSYCVGLDSSTFHADQAEQQAVLVEQHLQRKNCVGIKLYPGYNHIYIYDPVFDPFYQLAMHYKKPVAIHTGMTAGSHGLLKYSHPMTLDEAAVRYPEVQFIMCHMGNPWIVDAVAVLEKNNNIAADLSGILEGHIGDMTAFFAQKQGYLAFFKTWLEYLDAYDRLLYGTDWPLANISNYIDFVAHIIPEQHHEQVFFNNANRLYNLGL